jgi:integrase/recombinase XerD
MKVYSKEDGLNRIYDFDKRINTQIAKLKKINNINSKKVIEYYESGLKSNGLALATQEKWLNRTLRLCEWMNKEKKEFDKVKREDIIKFVEKYINKADNYSDNSKKLFKIALKKFYQWLKGCDEESYPEEVNWIKTRRIGASKHKKPEDLLSDEDIEKMIKAVEHPRDRALLMILAESGCRIGEILTLQIKSINFDDRGAYFLVDGKTGTRRVRVVNSTPYLHDWLQHHPDGENKEGPLWTVIGTTKNISKKLEDGEKIYEIKKGKDGKEIKKEKEYKLDWSFNLTYAAARSILIRAGKKAGIEKPINPHNFRHSRATVLGAAGLNQSLMNEIMGWKQGGRTSGTYIHLSGRQTDDALLPALYGMKVEEQKDKHPKMFPIKCISCGELNPYNVKRCKKCNTIIGVINQDDLQLNKAMIQMSQILGGMVNKGGDFKKELIENLKKEILQEIKPIRKKK